MPPSRAVAAYFVFCSLLPTLFAFAFGIFVQFFLVLIVALETQVPQTLWEDPEVLIPIPPLVHTVVD